MGKGAGTHHWSMHVETFYGVKVDISGGFDAKHMAATLRAFAESHEGDAEPLNPVPFLLPENGTAPRVRSYDFGIYVGDRRSLTGDMEEAEKAWKGAAEALDCDVQLLFFGNGGGDGYGDGGQVTIELFLVAGLTTKHKTKLGPDSGWGVGSTPIKMPSAEGQTQMDEELRTIMDTFGLKGNGPGLHLLSNAQDMGWG